MIKLTYGLQQLEAFKHGKHPISAVESAKSADTGKEGCFALKLN